MVQSMDGLKRTHTCGELTLKDAGGHATIMGWVLRRRDLGALIFADIRDRWGITQVVFDPQTDKEAFSEAERLRGEYVVAVSGTVEKRPEGTVNPNISTGEIELRARHVWILNTSRVSPFSLTEEQTTDEALRLKYRFLDLRRQSLLRNITFRHRLAKAVRDFFDAEGFLEVETPMLVRSTPEGARDYLVPSRVNPGKFYALPQSPQLFKQLLMVGGLEKYFQLARCFRDEDLRADRQPEFTQIDLEMSFVHQQDILEVIERMTAYVFEKTMGIRLRLPFPRLSYAEAVERFGTDKPDTRFPMEMFDVTDPLQDTSFEIARRTIAEGGRIKGISIPGRSNASRSEIDELTRLCVACGGKGILTIAASEGGFKSSLQKHLLDGDLKKIIEISGANCGDLIVLIADRAGVVNDILGRFRLEIAKRMKMIKPGTFEFLWVLDFPLFKYNEQEGRIEAEHHPFTSPHPGDIHLLETEPLGVRANAYDLVLNGVELGSGSIRIHQRELQEKIFKIIGLSPEEARAKFGFLLDAFEYGAPPHGGIALGFDRMAAIMAGVDNIREVLAFPKNASAECPLTGAPVEVSKEQLEPLGIRIERS